MRKFLICTLFLTACSLFSEEQVRSVTSYAPELNRVSESVYQLKDKAVFLTTLEDCRKPSSSTLESQARQLLVGFQDIKILSHETFAIKDLVVEYSEANASLDNIPLFVRSYTYSGDCLYDVIFWHKKGTSIEKAELDHIFFGMLNVSR